MVRSGNGEAHQEKDRSVDRLMDLLGEASAISKNVKLGILDYIVGMAILEVSEQTKMSRSQQR